MALLIVKAAQGVDDDRWFVWCTSEDNFTWFGTRKELRKQWRTEYGRSGKAALDQRMVRATERGSDSVLGLWFWDCEPELVHNIHDEHEHPLDWGAGHRYALPRENLGALWDRYRAWDDGPVGAPEPSYIDLLVVEVLEG